MRFVFLSSLILGLVPAALSASIVVGPFVFDDLAFADNATQLEPGSLQLGGGASDVDEALTGFSPTTGLFNIGSPSGTPDNANLFELEFLDFQALDLAGADIILFDARFSSDSYEVAVRRAGGEFSPFALFPASSGVNTSLGGPQGSRLVGIPIDLSLFGTTPAGTRFDAIRFRGAPNLGKNPPIEADPVMAAALNGEEVPEPSTMVLLGLGLLAAFGSNRRRRAR